MELALSTQIKDYQDQLQIHKITAEVEFKIFEII